MFREVGDRLSEATTLDRLAHSYHGAGDLDAARTAWRQALIIFDDLDHADADQVRAKLDQFNG